MKFPTVISRHFYVFILLTVFGLAQVSWWVVFQVNEGNRITRQQHAVWLVQIQTARQHRDIIPEASEEDFRPWLRRTFPDLTLASDSKDVVVTEEAQERLKHLAGSRVRMFTSEGMFFSLLLLLGVGYIYWIMHRDMQRQRQQTMFLAATSHELKTPITSLRLYLDTLTERELTADRKRELLATMRLDLERLTNQIDLLLAAQAFIVQKPKIPQVSANLTEETQAVLDEVYHRFDLRGFQFQSRLDPEIFANVDPDRWQTLVRNLLENAFKYSPEGGTVVVRLTRDAQHAVLEVSDNGVGFAPEERERIFGRFYRVGNEDTRRTRGTGLGLYLVKEIAESFRGKVSARSPGEGKGATFTVVLPCSRESGHV